MNIPQIVTLTVNPAVDMAATATEVRPVHKIRTFGEQYDPGGGGINVARVAHALGAETLALFAAGGVTGRFVEEMLSQVGVPWRSIPIRGTTRISLTVLDRASGLEYRFVPQGPSLDADECGVILAALEQIKADWLVASGSLPPSVPPEFYASVAQVAARRGIRFALDTSGDPLRAALGHGIDLLKSSLGEFESILGREVRDLSAQQMHAVSLVQSGAAQTIAVTLGSQGAILATANGATWLAAPQIEKRSAVGAGDSFLAGLVVGLAQGKPHHEALCLAVAAGAAAVSSFGTAQVRRDDVEALRLRISPAATAATSEALASRESRAPVRPFSVE